MLGIVLWYDAERRIGLVWCEDQGALAYLGPEVDLPLGCDVIERGTQIRFLVKEADGFRSVVHIHSKTMVPGLHAPDVLLHENRPGNRKSETAKGRPSLRIVA